MNTSAINLIEQGLAQLKAEPKWPLERAAFERGERVEIDFGDGDWRTLNLEYLFDDPNYKFRIAQPADPYAELKAAHAAGKVIQFNIGHRYGITWDDCRPGCAALSWCYPVDQYRIKPEPQPAIPEGFIPWHGGECPVAEGTKIEVVMRAGDVQPTSKPEDWRWNFASTAEQPSADIIAYRVIAPPWSLPPPPAGRQWHRSTDKSDVITCWPDSNPNWRLTLEGELVRESEDMYWDGRWSKISGKAERIAFPDAYYATLRPLPPSFVPWDCPEDVPLNCWIRKNLPDAKGYNTTQLFVMNVRYDGVDVGHRESFWSWAVLKAQAEYSTDRKTWHPCTKEAR